MADTGDIEAYSSSSDESTILTAQGNTNCLEAYQFEPYRESADESNSEDDSSSDNSSLSTTADTGIDENRERLDMFNWCGCGHCAVEHLQREKECLCCREKSAFKNSRMTDSNDNSCVTNHPDFTVLCLTPPVLRNVLVGLNNVRADHWEVNPPENSGYRYAAYRQFTWWIYGKLGAGRRRVIPACTTHKIREAFPKLAEEEYKGFISGEESETED